LVTTPNLEDINGGYMNLQIKSKNECTYDEVSMGEVMLRLDPGEGRIRTARTM